MKLTIIENKLIQKLPVQQKQFVIAKFSKTIRNTTDLELKERIIDIVQVTLAESGIRDQHDELVIKFLSNTLFEDLKKPKFNHLTLEEIKLAMSMGVRLSYGQFMGINITTIHYWLKCYQVDVDRENSLNKYNRMLSEAETINIPVKLSNAELLTHCLNAFEEYKKDGTMPFSPHATYEAIKELQGVKTLIKYSDWEKVKKEAKQNLVALTKSKASRKTDIPGMLKKLMYTTESQYEFEIKKVGLKYFFDELIKTDKPLLLTQYDN